MNLTNILSALGGIKGILPTLTTLGVPGAGLVSKGLEVAQLVKRKVDEGKLIASANEASDLDALIADLEAEAAVLDQRVQDS